MLNKKIAFALISFVTLSASSAMAQDANSQVGVIDQNAHTVNTAVDGIAISNTQQKADLFLNQQDYDHLGGYGQVDYNNQLGVIQQDAYTTNTGIGGAAISNTEQDASGYLNQIDF